MTFKERVLIDTVAYNGNLLINVGPKAGPRRWQCISCGIRTTASCIIGTSKSIPAITTASAARPLCWSFNVALSRMITESSLTSFKRQCSNQNSNKTLSVAQLY